MTDEGSERRPEAETAAALIDPADLRCSFCGKGSADVEAIVCGPTPSVAICNECVELCNEIVAEQRSGPTQAA
jgi:ATP-dependent Clp protease ATP-binding subunit ClpX